jgi:hypothetical protein
LATALSLPEVDDSLAARSREIHASAQLDLGLQPIQDRITWHTITTQVDFVCALPNFVLGRFMIHRDGQLGGLHLADRLSTAPLAYPIAVL